MNALIVSSTRSGLTNLPRRRVPDTPRFGVAGIGSGSYLDYATVILQHLPAKLRGIEGARANLHVEKAIRFGGHTATWGARRRFPTRARHIKPEER
jgi:hypothetical protein